MKLVMWVHPRCFWSAVRLILIFNRYWYVWRTVHVLEWRFGARVCVGLTYGHLRRRSLLRWSSAPQFIVKPAELNDTRRFIITQSTNIPFFHSVKCISTTQKVLNMTTLPLYRQSTHLGHDLRAALIFSWYTSFHTDVMTRFNPSNVVGAL